MDNIEMNTHFGFFPMLNYFKNCDELRSVQNCTCCNEHQNKLSLLDFNIKLFEGERPEPIKTNCKCKCKTITDNLHWIYKDFYEYLTETMYYFMENNNYDSITQEDFSNSIDEKTSDRIDIIISEKNAYQAFIEKKLLFIKYKYQRREHYENGVLKNTHFYDHYLVRVDKYIYDVVYLIDEPDMDYVFDDQLYNKKKYDESAYDSITQLFYLRMITMS